MPPLTRTRADASYDARCLCMERLETWQIAAICCAVGALILACYCVRKRAAIYDSAMLAISRV
jgi:hypothetical protein